MYQMGDREMTKKEAKARKVAWNTAIANGLVLRFASGQWFRSYSSVEARNEALVTAIAVGVSCEVVKV